MSTTLLRRIVITATVISCLLWWSFYLDGSRDERTIYLHTKERMKGPLSFDDPGLLQVVKDRYIEPPSGRPYNLSANKPKMFYRFSSFKTSIHSWMYIDKELRKMFDQWNGEGFFVEAGALDGEYLSNTLFYLEMEKNWKGLLVEADRDSFSLLKGKNRKAWACHCCLSPQAYPYEAVFQRFTAGVEQKTVGMLKDQGLKLLNFDHISHSVYDSVQCLPLATLLIALNVTHVDVVSLDVEGAEKGVLQHFPWGRILVDVWVVEHEDDTEKWSSNEESAKQLSIGKIPRDRLLGSDGYVDKDFTDFFATRGYVLYSISNDHYPRNYVFIREESDHYKRLF
ncbi:uncharacterized protein LOC143039688 [Oratosquilla oratoria]|uniref:uncharacterized protein LOC143039688 n=1 Tax=Oratosquilla oratoria TaxID=337810 RepID=UPI003F76317A